MMDKNKDLDSNDVVTGIVLTKWRILKVENIESITVKAEDEKEVISHVRTSLDLIIYKKLEMDVSQGKLADYMLEDQVNKVYVV